MTPSFSQSDEELYQARFERRARRLAGPAGLAAYEPLETVAGAKAAPPLPTRDNPTLSNGALAKAEEYVSGRNTSALLVWRNGALEHERYYADFDQDSLVVSKALAKPLTAILVGRAIEQGHIQSLDQPIIDFFPEWADAPLKSQILVRHLLDMRTGLLPQGFAHHINDVRIRAYLHPRHIDVILTEYPMAAAPGSTYGYSNATSELVALLIERATSKPYADYLSQDLLEPIGAKGGQVWVNRKGGTAHAGCCLLMPARSFLRTAILLLQDGVWDGKRLLPEGYVAAMRKGTDQNPHYGLGLWLPGPYVERRGFYNPAINFGKVLHSEPYLDRDIFLFDGNGNQVVYMIPSADMIVMRLGGFSPRALPEWDNSYLANLLIRDAFRASKDKMPTPQPR